jgi:ribonuclease Z
MRFIRRTVFQGRDEKWKKYHSAFHSSSSQVARIAKEANPKLMILNHVLMWDSSEEKLMSEICTKYNGKVILGKDLDSF